MAITDKIPRLNLRETRARQLASAVLGVLDDHISRNSRGDVFDALIDLFLIQGVEVLTDYDREQAGLSPRGPNGWTLEELVAWERKKLEALTSVMAPVIVRVPTEPK